MILSSGTDAEKCGQYFRPRLRVIPSSVGTIRMREGAYFERVEQRHQLVRGGAGRDGTRRVLEALNVDAAPLVVSPLCRETPRLFGSQPTRAGKWRQKKSRGTLGCTSQREWNVGGGDRVVAFDCHQDHLRGHNTALAKERASQVEGNLAAAERFQLRTSGMGRTPKQTRVARPQDGTTPGGAFQDLTVANGGAKAQEAQGRDKRKGKPRHRPRRWS